MTRARLQLAVAIVVLASLPVLAQTTGGIEGRIIEWQSQAPLADAVVVATSPALQGEQTAVTDASGSFAIALLPAGSYTLTVARAEYQSFTQTGLVVRLDRTIRVELQLFPEVMRSVDVVVTAARPAIATTSESAGAAISQQQMTLIPYGRDARTFDAVVQAVPGVHTDPFGSAINGAGSAESMYLIDGVQVNDPAYGTQGTTLLQDFIQEVDVKTGGYQTEYGRATAGIVNVVTKSGGNELHGSVFGNWSPLEATRKQVGSPLFALATQSRQNYNLDFGAELGGPIIKDRLWFYAGFAPQFISGNYDRIIQAQRDDGTGRPVLDAMGNPAVSEVARQTYVQTQTSYQFTGKLTFLVNESHTLSLALYGNPSIATGGEGNGNDGVFRGASQRLGSIDVALRYAGKLLSKSMLVEASVAVHSQSGDLYHPSQVLQGVDGLSSAVVRDTPNITWRGTRNLLDPAFDDGMVPDSQKSTAVLSRCAPTASGFDPCPVQNYQTGGPGFLSFNQLIRIAPSLKLSNFVELLGHHHFKYGADATFDSYRSDKFVSGGQLFNDYGVASGTGNVSQADAGTDEDFEGRGYGRASPLHPTSPLFARNARPGYFDFANNEPVQTTHNLSLAEYAQDSWAIADRVVLDLGVRVEQQRIQPASNQVDSLGQPLPASSIALNNLMPRVGIIYDWTGRGLSKVYASAGRYYEYVPLDLADRALSSESTAYFGTNALSCGRRLTPAAGPLAFDPRGCQLIPGSYSFGSGTTPVDPRLQSGWNHGQYTDQFGAGVQYQAYRDVVVGIDYAHQKIGQVIEDMSSDITTNFFLSNPGVPGALGYSGETRSGTTIYFPSPTRVYDGLTLSVNKAFSDHYLLSASYTHSAFRGNYPGLYDAELGGQLDPNITALYDLVEALPNSSGPLKGDIPNSFKIDGAYVYELDALTALQCGARLQADEGQPTNYLGGQWAYGPGAIFILPRGSGQRLPWQWQVDLRASLKRTVSREFALAVTADIFNLTNNQAVTSVDENYTFGNVYPIVNGKRQDLAFLKTTAGEPVPKNLAFGAPQAYQLPLSARIGARFSF